MANSKIQSIGAQQKVFYLFMLAYINNLLIYIYDIYINYIIYIYYSIYIYIIYIYIYIILYIYIYIIYIYIL